MKTKKGLNTVQAIKPENRKFSGRLKAGALTCLVLQLTVPGAAQSFCPEGMIPSQSKCISPVGGNSPKAVSEAVFESRYGALASNGDAENRIVGAAAGEESEAIAMTVALDKCGKACRIWVSVRNSCLAVAESESEPVVSVYSAGQSRSIAEKKAIKDCRTKSKEFCTAKYSACSLPVRVR